MSNTESSFRNAFKNFGARGGVSVGANGVSGTSRPGPSGFGGRASSWFGGVRSQVSGYVPVSLGGSQQPVEESWLDLTWFQRMTGFGICLAGGLACFMILKSQIMTLVGAVIEGFAFLWYFTSYSPVSGGSIRLGSQVGSLLPVYFNSYFNSYFHKALLHRTMTGEGKFFTKLQFYKSLFNGRHYSHDQIPDLSNKVALITGANQGVGYATTLTLVAHGAHVVMACRSEVKANDAIE
ncbi:hypothetical protein BGZ82_000420 [Podila clonocystis]|nr:hypothetical protein BGZ82_000420 [Podila clonocystis]